MIISKKIRLKPTPEQTIQLYKSSGTARWVYNWTLQRQQDNYNSGGKFLSDNTLRKEITQLKKKDEFKWLNDVSNNVPKQAIKDACNAFKSFFKGKTKYPKFKTKRHSKLSFYNDNMKLKSKVNSVLIEKVGWVKTSEKVPNAKYYNPRISFDGKYWYLSFGIEVEFEKEPLTDKILGIDLGIKDLAVCSDGTVYKNINKTNEVKKTKKRLRRLQRGVSRKYQMNRKGGTFAKTCNIIKMEKRIQRLHRRLVNIRNNYIHQTTTSIVRTKPCVIVMEDLNISGMMKNRHLAKAIQEQKLHEFKRQMIYKCEKFGIKFVEANKFYPSSKRCSNCGRLKRDLKLSNRTYCCDCGLHINRDLNAAINLAQYGMLA